MKKVILIIAALLVMASCGDKRFERLGDGVWYDKTTKVEYYKVRGEFGTTMCVLVDADGKPLLYQEK